MNDRMIQRLHVMGTPRRLQILTALATHHGYSVMVLAERLGIKQPTMSYHLMHLMHAGLVSPEREGTFTYYQIEQAALRELIAQLTSLLEDAP